MKAARWAWRLTRGAGAHDRLRTAIMLLGVAVATLGLLVGIALPRVASAQQSLRDHRTPITSATAPTTGRTGIQVQELQVHGVPWTSFVVSQPNSKLLPPGITAWPLPGHTIVSPRLRQLITTGVVDVSSLGSIDASDVGEAGLASPDELFSITTNPGSGGRQLLGFGMVSSSQEVSPHLLWLEVVGLVGFPALVLLWTSLGLSASARRHRFTVLTRMGADPDLCGRIFAAEVCVVAGLGALFGLAAFVPLQRALGASGILGITWWPGQAAFSWPWWVAITAAVLIGSTVMARKALRGMLTNEPANRRAGRRQWVGGLGVLLVLAALGLEGWTCITMVRMPPGRHLGDRGVGVIMGGVVIGVLGAVLAGSAIVAWLQAHGEQLPLAGRLGLALAQAHYRASSAMVAALTMMIGLAGFGSGFLVAGANSASGDLHHVRVQVPYDQRSTAEQEALLRIERPHQQIWLTDDYLMIVAATCSDRRIFDADVQGCPALPAATAATPTTLHLTSDGRHITRRFTPTSTLPETSVNDVWIAPTDPLVAGIPAVFLEFDADSTTHDLDHLIDELHAAAPSFTPHVGVDDPAALQAFLQQQATLRSVLIGGFLLILLACMATLIELRWGMRRTIAGQQALGTPTRLLRTSFLVQLLTSILPAQTIALVLGVLAGWAINASIGATSARDSFTGSIVVAPLLMWSASLAAVLLAGWTTGAPKFHLTHLRDDR